MHDHILFGVWVFAIFSSFTLGAAMGASITWIEMTKKRLMKEFASRP